MYIWLIIKNSLLILMIEILIMTRIILNIDLFILLIITALLFLVYIFVYIVLGFFRIDLIIDRIKIAILVSPVCLSISKFSLQIFFTQIIQVISLWHYFLSYHNLVFVVLSRVRHRIESIRAYHVILLCFHFYFAHFLTSLSCIHRNFDVF